MRPDPTTHATNPMWLPTAPTAITGKIRYQEGGGKAVDVVATCADDGATLRLSIGGGPPMPLRASKDIRSMTVLPALLQEEGVYVLVKMRGKPLKHADDPKKTPRQFFGEWILLALTPPVLTREVGDSVRVTLSGLDDAARADVDGLADSCMEEAVAALVGDRCWRSALAWARAFALRIPPLHIDRRVTPIRANVGDDPVVLRAIRDAGVHVLVHLEASPVLVINCNSLTAVVVVKPQRSSQNHTVALVPSSPGSPVIFLEHMVEAYVVPLQLYLYDHVPAVPQFVWRVMTATDLPWDQVIPEDARSSGDAADLLEHLAEVCGDARIRPKRTGMLGRAAPEPPKPLCDYETGALLVRAVDAEDEADAADKAFIDDGSVDDDDAMDVDEDETRADWDLQRALDVVRRAKSKQRSRSASKSRKRRRRVVADEDDDNAGQASPNRIARDESASKVRKRRRRVVPEDDDDDGGQASPKRVARDEAPPPYSEAVRAPEATADGTGAVAPVANGRVGNGADDSGSDTDDDGEYVPTPSHTAEYSDDVSEDGDDDGDAWESE